jgi:ParB family chromosome partitioning protein
MEDDKENNFRTIPISKINLENIDKWNVRTLDKNKGIEDLTESILDNGLLQPIVVFQEGDKFNLVIGQRRLRAFKELIRRGHSQFKEIPAIILLKKPDQEKSKILSLSENIHRVELNREDIVKIITYLYNKYNKSVKRVSRILGKQAGYIYDYLKIDTAPQEVKEMYYSKMISKQDVKRIMELAPENKGDMIKLAKEFVKLTPPERIRTVEIKKSSPEIKTDELIKKAKSTYTEEKIVVPLSPPLLMALDNAVKEIGLSREEIARKAIEDWLSNKGFYK